MFNKFEILFCLWCYLFLFFSMVCFLNCVVREELYVFPQHIPCYVINSNIYFICGFIWEGWWWLVP